jgi:hypothetical protein
MGACQSAAAARDEKKHQRHRSPVKLRHSNSTGSLKSKFSAKLRNSQILKLSKKDSSKRNSVAAQSAVQSPSHKPHQQEDGQSAYENLPLIKVKLVDFLEFQEFNTLVETIEIKTCNETYFLKNHSEEHSQLNSSDTVMSSASSASSLPKQVLNEIINTNNNNNNTMTNPRREISTNIPIMNRFGFKPLTKPIEQPEASAIVDSTGASNSSYASSVASASPTTSTTSSNANTNSNASRRRYFSPHKTFVKQPTSFLNTQPGTTSSDKQAKSASSGLKTSNLVSFMPGQQRTQQSQQPKSQSSSVSSLASSSSSTNISGNVSSNATTHVNSNTSNTNFETTSSMLKPNRPSTTSSFGSGTIKSNLQNSNINKLPVKKEIATLSVPIKKAPSTFLPPPTTIQNKFGPSGNATHRKHSFTPYSLNINNAGLDASRTESVGVAVSEKPPESSQLSSRLPAPSKILRYSSKLPSATTATNKLTATSNLKTFASNRNEPDYMDEAGVEKRDADAAEKDGPVSLSIKREDSAYCSSTSSTVSSTSSCTEPSGASSQNQVLIVNDDELKDTKKPDEFNADEKQQMVDHKNEDEDLNGFEIDRDQISDRERAIYEKNEVS